MTSNNKINYLFLGLIILFALFLRMNAALHTEVDNPIRADALHYYSYSYNMNNYRVYSHFSTFIKPGVPPPDAMRTPGYPLFLLPFTKYAPTKFTILNIKILQGMLGVITVLLSYFLAIRLLPQIWALIPVLLVAISPHIISSGTYVLTETFFTFLLVSMVLVAFKHMENKSILWGLAAGVVLGLTALTKPTMQYFLFLYFLIIFFTFEENRVKNITVLLLGYVFVVSPWLIRNMLSVGIFSDPSLTINTLHHGMYPQFMYDGRPETYGFPYRFDPDVSSFTQSVGAVLNEIYSRFINEPITYLKWYLVQKPLAFFSWSIIAGMGDIYIYPTVKSPYFNSPVFAYTRYFMYLTHWSWMVLGVLSAFIALFSFTKKSASTTTTHLFMASIVFYFIVVHMVGFPIPRYAIPLQPFMYILAIYVLYLAVKKIRTAVFTKN